jgi:hypothetical protein
VTTPGIIDQNHQLILEDCRISAKPITEQLGISHLGKFQSDFGLMHTGLKFIQNKLDTTSILEDRRWQVPPKQLYLSTNQIPS